MGKKWRSQEGESSSSKKQGSHPASYPKKSCEDHGARRRWCSNKKSREVQAPGSRVAQSFEAHQRFQGTYGGGERGQHAPERAGEAARASSFVGRDANKKRMQQEEVQPGFICWHKGMLEKKGSFSYENPSKMRQGRGGVWVLVKKGENFLDYP